MAYLRNVGNRIMRVPNSFYYEIERIRLKRGYTTNSEFLHKEVVPILKHSDSLTDLFSWKYKNVKKK